MGQVTSRQRGSFEVNGPKGEVATNGGVKGEVKVEANGVSPGGESSGNGTHTDKDKKDKSRKRRKPLFSFKRNNSSRRRKKLKKKESNGATRKSSNDKGANKSSIEEIEELPEGAVGGEPAPVAQKPEGEGDTSSQLTSSDKSDGSGKKDKKSKKDKKKGSKKDKKKESKKDAKKEAKKSKSEKKEARKISKEQSTTETSVETSLPTVDETPQQAEVSQQAQAAPPQASVTSPSTSAEPAAVSAETTTSEVPLVTSVKAAVAAIEAGNAVQTSDDSEVVQSLVVEESVVPTSDVTVEMSPGAAPTQGEEQSKKEEEGQKEGTGSSTLVEEVMAAATTIDQNFATPAIKVIPASPTPEDNSSPTLELPSPTPTTDTTPQEPTSSVTSAPAVAEVVVEVVETKIEAQAASSPPEATKAEKEAEPVPDTPPQPPATLPPSESQENLTQLESSITCEATPTMQATPPTTPPAPTTPTAATTPPAPTTPTTPTTPTAATTPLATPTMDSPDGAEGDVTLRQKDDDGGKNPAKRSSSDSSSSNLLKRISLGPRLRTAILKRFGSSSDAKASPSPDKHMSLTRPKSVEIPELVPPPRRQRPRRPVEQIYSPDRPRSMHLCDMREEEAVSLDDKSPSSSKAAPGQDTEVKVDEKVKVDGVKVEIKPDIVTVARAEAVEVIDMATTSSELKATPSEVKDGEPQVQEAEEETIVPVLNARDDAIGARFMAVVAMATEKAAESQRAAESQDDSAAETPVEIVDSKPSVEVVEETVVSEVDVAIEAAVTVVKADSGAVAKDAEEADTLQGQTDVSEAETIRASVFGGVESAFQEPKESEIQEVQEEEIVPEVRQIQVEVVQHLIKLAAKTESKQEDTVQEVSIATDAMDSAQPETEQLPEAVQPDIVVSSATLTLSVAPAPSSPENKGENSVDETIVVDKIEETVDVSVEEKEDGKTEEKDQTFTSEKPDEKAEEKKVEDAAKSPTDDGNNQSEEATREIARAVVSEVVEKAFQEIKGENSTLTLERVRELREDERHLTKDDSVESCDTDVTLVDHDDDHVDEAVDESSKENGHADDASKPDAESKETEASVQEQAVTAEASAPCHTSPSEEAVPSAPAEHSKPESNGSSHPEIADSAKSLETDTKGDNSDVGASGEGETNAPDSPGSTVVHNGEISGENAAEKTEMPVKSSCGEPAVDQSQDEASTVK